MRGRFTQTRATRILAVLWLVSFIAAFPVGFTWAALSMWRTHVSTTQPTATNDVPYESHGRIYFAPVGVARWHDRFNTVYPALLISFGALTVITWVAANYSDAIGRRWTGS